MLPTNMMLIFGSCSNLTTVDLSDLDLSKCTQTFMMFSGCTKLTTLRLDNCSKDTISKIITNGGLPIFDAFAGGHYIYCKRANVTDLTPPQGWYFSYVD